jgi:hypothetical protein
MNDAIQELSFGVLRFDFFEEKESVSEAEERLLGNSNLC